MNWEIFLDGLLIISIFAFAAWLLSIYLRNVGIVDSAWSLMILAAAIVYLVQFGRFDLKNTIIIILVTAWALRLSVHLTWRNWGEPEDRRYRAIREKYSPNFQIKSLLIIFMFQAILAWIVTLPLLGSIILESQDTLLATGIFISGILFWIIGMFFESVADWQLTSFKKNPANHGKVMNTGLWKYSRHPNYFGECLIWWGFFLIALSSGAWWSLLSPLLMTWLLLKFSGVVMLEETITERRPGYREYVKCTNAFIPGSVKSC